MDEYAVLWHLKAAVASPTNRSRAMIVFPRVNIIKQPEHIGSLVWPQSAALSYGRRRDCSLHRQSRTVRESFPSHGSSVYGHWILIPASASRLRIFSVSASLA